ncbi:MAG: hypothetical protein HUJ89_01540 [Bacteroidales bacterium]|nr:hypothetical protein [Bacteroidales bacterium]
MNDSPSYFRESDDNFYLLTDKEAVDYIEDSIGTGFVNGIRRIGAEGILATLEDLCSEQGLGYDLITDPELDEKQFLYGNTPYIAIVWLSEDQQDDFENFMFSHDISILLSGTVTDGEKLIDDEIVDD